MAHHPPGGGNVSKGRTDPYHRRNGPAREWSPGVSSDARRGLSGGGASPLQAPSALGRLEAGREPAGGADLPRRRNQGRLHQP